MVFPGPGPSTPMGRSCAPSCRKTRRATAPPVSRGIAWRSPARRERRRGAGPLQHSAISPLGVSCARSGHERPQERPRAILANRVPKSEMALCGALTRSTSLLASKRRATVARRAQPTTSRSPAYRRRGAVRRARRRSLAAGAGGETKLALRTDRRRACDVSTAAAGSALHQGIHPTSSPVDLGIDPPLPPAFS